MSFEQCPISNNYALFKGVKVALPALYADFNSNQSPSYYDYENVGIYWASPNGIEIVRKIGRGKYSEVFQGAIKTDSGPEIDCVIKILKPVKKKKIRREITILHNLKDGPHIVKLLEVVKDPVSRTPSLVTEYIENCDFRTLYPKLNDYDIRYYMYKILITLDYCNSKGIMHRDLKPHNIMIDHNKRDLRLIDWGLAEYYHPGRCYNVRVASRFYKPPELLLDFQVYDYSLDIWSLGCILAGIIFRADPFFCGSDNYDQLYQIVKVLGSEDFARYKAKYKLVLSSNYRNINFDGLKKKPWTSFVKSSNQMIANQEALDLLSKLLVYDHTQRLIPKQAMEHPYFDPVRHEFQSNNTSEK